MPASIARPTCAAANPGRPFAPRPIGRFAHQIGDGLDPGGELFLVLGQARAVLDQPADGGGLERRQVLGVRDRGDDPGVVGFAGGVAVEPVVEIGGDLEQLVEIGIVVVQQIIKHLNS